MKISNTSVISETKEAKLDVVDLFCKNPWIHPGFSIIKSFVYQLCNLQLITLNGFENTERIEMGLHLVISLSLFSNIGTILAFFQIYGNIPPRSKAFAQFYTNIGAIIIRLYTLLYIKV